MYNLKYNRAKALNLAFIACIISTIVVFIINLLPYQISLTREFKFGYPNLVIPSMSTWYLPLFVFLIVFEIRYIYYLLKIFDKEDIRNIFFFCVFGLVVGIISITISLNETFMELVLMLVFICILISIFLTAFNPPKSYDQGYQSFVMGISVKCFTITLSTALIASYIGISTVLIDLIDLFLTTLFCVSVVVMCIHAILPSVIAICERLWVVIKSPSIKGIASSEQVSD